jgi:SnoaL-like protein
MALVNRSKEAVMAEIATVVNNYIAAWNESDQDRRRALVDETFTEDATYLDPLVAGEGADGIEAMIAGVQGAYPGHVFRLVSGPDAHHDRVRFTWQLHGESGPVATGIDFATVSEDGRLRDITGFLEQPAA